MVTDVTAVVDGWFGIRRKPAGLLAQVTKTVTSTWRVTSA